MRKFLVPLMLLVSLIIVGLAQDTNNSEKRLIVIDSSGGTQEGNLRKGPIFYEHPEPEGIKATVSTLSIFSQKAELRTPEGETELTLSDAKGQRIATFSEGVRVTRGRLEALGPTLSYDEATGIGLLRESADITVAPKSEDAQPVLISAAEAEFDVDTDVSISRGDVKLDNGNQKAEADEMEYEEERTLGVLRCEGRQCTITREDEEGGLLVITADEIRVLTDDKKLYATGNVTVVDADITSTGDEVFFDDALSLAEIIGNARSVNEAEGFTLTGARILQDIDFDFVEVLDDSVPSDFNSEDYLLTSEQ